MTGGAKQKTPMQDKGKKGSKVPPPLVLLASQSTGPGRYACRLQGGQHTYVFVSSLLGPSLGNSLIERFEKYVGMPRPSIDGIHWTTLDRIVTDKSPILAEIPQDENEPPVEPVHLRAEPMETDGSSAAVKMETGSDDLFPPLSQPAPTFAAIAANGAAAAVNASPSPDERRDRKPPVMGMIFPKVLYQLFVFQIFVARFVLPFCNYFNTTCIN